MGIVNTTPDSFSDGGRYVDLDAAMRRVDAMIADGADIIDIGGESTRPFAPPVSLDEELDRTIPLLEKLRDHGVPLSVDTYKPAVMAAALAAGADMINDIWALRQPGAIEAIRDSNCGLCVMHMHGEPESMQNRSFVDDVVAEVTNFLERRVDILLKSGIQTERICVDPGFGFGKSVEQNYALLKHLELTRVGYPLLAGVSRKAMLRKKTGRTPQDCLSSSVTAAVIAVERGAAIVRVHDVAQTRDALSILEALQAA
jgi:dihydropteroate synthase